MGRDQGHPGWAQVAEVQGVEGGQGGQGLDHGEARDRQHHLPGPCSQVGPGRGPHRVAEPGADGVGQGTGDGGPTTARPGDSARRPVGDQARRRLVEERRHRHLGLQREAPADRVAPQARGQQDHGTVDRPGGQDEVVGLDPEGCHRSAVGQPDNRALRGGDPAPVVLQPPEPEPAHEPGRQYQVYSAVDRRARASCSAIRGSVCAMNPSMPRAT